MDTYSVDLVLCPFCKKRYVETFNADLPDIISGAVYGGMEWSCPECGKEGTLTYAAAYVGLTLFDDCGDEVGEVD